MEGAEANPSVEDALAEAALLMGTSSTKEVARVYATLLPSFFEGIAHLVRVLTPVS
jgi:hypothetical protein